MNRRAFLAALALAPFFKWAQRQVPNPNWVTPKGWFIAEFKHYPSKLHTPCSMIIFRREKPVDKPEWHELEVPH